MSKCISDFLPILIWSMKVSTYTSVHLFIKNMYLVLHHFFMPKQLVFKSDWKLTLSTSRNLTSSWSSSWSLWLSFFFWLPWLMEISLVSRSFCNSLGLLLIFYVFIDTFKCTNFKKSYSGGTLLSGVNQGSSNFVSFILPILIVLNSA